MGVQMLDDARLRIFKAVAEEGGFTKAAYRLGITQPAVSQSIAELEKSTGRILINRSRNKTELSADGRILYAHAVEILEKYDDLQNVMQGKDAIMATDSLVIGVSQDTVGAVCNAVIPYLMGINPHIRISVAEDSERCDIRVFMEDGEPHVEASESMESSPIVQIIRKRIKP